MARSDLSAEMAAGDAAAKRAFDSAASLMSNPTDQRQQASSWSSPNKPTSAPSRSLSGGGRRRCSGPRVAPDQLSSSQWVHTVSRQGRVTTRVTLPTGVVLDDTRIGAVLLSSGGDHPIGFSPFAGPRTSTTRSAPGAHRQLVGLARNRVVNRVDGVGLNGRHGRCRAGGAKPPGPASPSSHRRRDLRPDSSPNGEVRPTTLGGQSKCSATRRQPGPMADLVDGLPDASSSSMTTSLGATDPRRTPVSISRGGRVPVPRGRAVLVRDRAIAVSPAPAVVMDPNAVRRLLRNLTQPLGAVA